MLKIKRQVIRQFLIRYGFGVVKIIAHKILYLPLLTVLVLCFDKFLAPVRLVIFERRHIGRGIREKILLSHELTPVKNKPCDEGGIKAECGGFSQLSHKFGGGYFRNIHIELCRDIDFTQFLHPVFFTSGESAFLGIVDTRADEFACGIF